MRSAVLLPSPKPNSTSSRSPLAKVWVALVPESPTVTEKFAAVLVTVIRASVCERQPSCPVEWLASPTIDVVSRFAAVTHAAASPVTTVTRIAILPLVPVP